MERTEELEGCRDQQQHTLTPAAAAGKTLADSNSNRRAAGGEGATMEPATTHVNSSSNNTELDDNLKLEKVSSFDLRTEELEGCRDQKSRWSPYVGG